MILYFVPYYKNGLNFFLKHVARFKFFFQIFRQKLNFYIEKYAS